MDKQQILNLLNEQMKEEEDMMKAYRHDEENQDIYKKYRHSWSTLFILIEKIEDNE